MPSKSSHDPSRKANSRLTRQALFHHRLNQFGERDASTQYISLYTSTVNSESVPSEFSPQDEARILALERELEREDMASSISSTEVSRQRKIAVRANYTTAAPFGSRIPTHAKPTTKHTEQQSQTSQTSSSQHSSAMKFHRSAPQPGKVYSKPNDSFDDSTWRHGAELRRLKEQALEAARFKPETRELFGMNVFSGEPEVDWDEEDSDDAPTATIDSIIPDVYPPHSVVGSAAELGTYLASSNYVISLGGPPLPEMRYGIVIVPINEERLLFPGYGDHAAMPDELKKQIYSKSKAMQHEQVEALRKQAEEVVNPVDQGNHHEVSQRKWILPVGSPEFAKGGTWVIRTGPAQPGVYYDRDNCDTSEIDPLDKTKRFTSTPLPKAANQSVSESVVSSDKPKRVAGTPPLQSSVPDTADYDDKTDYEEVEDDKTEQAKTEDTPETKPFDVKIFPIAKSPVQKTEEAKELPGRRSAPLPIASESDDREWFRDYFRRSLSPDHGMRPSEEDNYQFQLRRRRVLERRGEALSDSHVEEYSTSKLQHPQPTRTIAQILLPEDKEEVVAQKEPSAETSGSQTSGSISCGSSTETDATSNPYPTDPNLADLEKSKTPLQPIQTVQPVQPAQPVRSSQSPRTLQSSQQAQPSQRVESPQLPQTLQARQSPQPHQQSRPPQQPRTSSPPSVRHLSNDAHDRSIRAKACDTLKHLLRVPEKRPATPQVSSMPRKAMKSWSPPPRQTAQVRNARMDATRVITSLANSDPNENPGVDPRVREAAEVGLGYKPSRPLSRTY